MSDIETTLARGLAVQLGRWRAALDSGDARLGWKIGFNVAPVRAKLGLPRPLVGYLVGARHVPDGGRYAANGEPLVLEGELALRIDAELPAGASPAQGRAAIGAVAPAIELVVKAPPPADFAQALADNLFHRAVAIGAPRPLPADLTGPQVQARALVDGVQASVGEPAIRLPQDLGALACLVADTLAAQGERLAPGDWIISGSVTVPVDVAPGQEAVVELDGLGRVALRVDA